MKVRRWQKRLLIVLAVLAAFLLFCYLLQRFWAHRNGYFLPDYPRVTLTEDSDYETIFLQTGLGRSAVDKLLSGGDFQTILNAQDAFFNPPKADCTPLLGWFTREDRLTDGTGTPLIDLQPGTSSSPCPLTPLAGGTATRVWSLTAAPLWNAWCWEPTPPL